MAVSDERLLRRAASGDTDAANELLARHTAIVGHVIRDFGWTAGSSEAGLPLDDAKQAGLVGLWVAILKYRPADEQGGDRPASFGTYARHVVRNRIRDAIRSARSLANEPLNKGVSYDETVNEHVSEGLARSGGMESATAEDLPEHELTPSAAEGALAEAAMSYDLARLRAVLTDQEYSVLMAHLSGASYHEIATDLAVSYKAVDGAMQRIRRKARALAS